VSEFVKKENYIRALIKDLGALPRKIKRILKYDEVLKLKIRISNCCEPWKCNYPHLEIVENLEIRLGI